MCVCVHALSGGRENAYIGLNRYLSKYSYKEEVASQMLIIIFFFFKWGCGAANKGNNLAYWAKLSADDILEYFYYHSQKMKI